MSEVARTGRALQVRRFLIYLAVGVTAFIVDFGLLVLFREVVGTPVWVAATIAFLAGEQGSGINGQAITVALGGGW